MCCRRDQPKDEIQLKNKVCEPGVATPESRESSIQVEPQSKTRELQLAAIERWEGGFSSRVASKDMQANYHRSGL